MLSSSTWSSKQQQHMNDHNNTNNINHLMVSPEVLGRLRKVQEDDDEGRYSQSSAGEYTSTWGGETDESMTEDSSTETEDEEVRHIVSLNKRQQDIINLKEFNAMNNSNNKNDNDSSPFSTSSTNTQTTWEINDFGRVESLVHMPSFGQNVFAAVHTHGDVVFWYFAPSM